MHDEHGIGQMSQNAGVVADHQEGCAEGVAQLAEQGRELDHQNRVEGGEGFVGDDERRTAGERHGDEHTLPLAAAQLMRIGGTEARRRAQAGELKQPLDFGAKFAPGGGPMRAHHFRHLIARAQYGIQGQQRVLRDERDAAAADGLKRGFGEPHEIGSAETDGAAEGETGARQKLQESMRERGFAAARFAEQAYDFAGRDVESDTGKQPLLTGNKIDRQIAHLKHPLYSTIEPRASMAAARFRFYAELNDFLVAEDRGRAVERRFDAGGSVKDFIEGFGVPHTEVELVLVNGQPVDFTYRVRDGDAVSVYPVFESLDVSPVARVRSAPLRDLRFVLDVHLGRLAAYLRMAGFDAEYRNDAGDAELAGTVARERRVILTRDRYLLMRAKVDRGYWVRSTAPKQQLAEVLKRFDLVGSMRPFTRCMRCNGELLAVNREEVWDQLPERVRERNEFRRCARCGRIYWEGTHHARMRKLIEWASMSEPRP